eukprot:224387-Pleurochrysis_carterae.AAC.2
MWYSSGGSVRMVNMIRGCSHPIGVQARSRVTPGYRGVRGSCGNEWLPASLGRALFALKPARGGANCASALPRGCACAACTAARVRAFVRLLAWMRASACTLRVQVRAAARADLSDRLVCRVLDDRVPRLEAAVVLEEAEVSPPPPATDSKGQCAHESGGSAHGGGSTLRCARTVAAVQDAGLDHGRADQTFKKAEKAVGTWNMRLSHN